MKIAKDIAEALHVDDMRYFGRTGTCEPEQTAGEIITTHLAPIREIANRLAAWGDGPIVLPHFDCPSAAKDGREILRLLGEEEV